MNEEENRRKRMYLNKYVFFHLMDLNDGFDVPSISYFSEDQFQIVLERVKEKGLGVYGIEPWFKPEGKECYEYYAVDTFENYKTTPQDPEWYFTAFDKFKKTGKELQYSASYYVPGNCWI